MMNHMQEKQFHGPDLSQYPQVCQTTATYILGPVNISSYEYWQLLFLRWKYKSNIHWPVMEVELKRTADTLNPLSFIVKLGSRPCPPTTTQQTFLSEITQISLHKVEQKHKERFRDTSECDHWHGQAKIT